MKLFSNMSTKREAQEFKTIINSDHVTSFSILSLQDWEESETFMYPMFKNQMKTIRSMNSFSRKFPQIADSYKIWSLIVR